MTVGRVGLVAVGLVAVGLVASCCGTAGGELAFVLCGVLVFFTSRLWHRSAER